MIPAISIPRQALRAWTRLPVAAAVFIPANVHASLLHGETLDKVADVLSWVVLVLVPVVGIVVFWLVHILPEKIAEKKGHPQAKAIQCLCLLSLAFGGLLWPIAWLWAYTKPVLHKLAYGTDVDHSHGHGDAKTEVKAEGEAKPSKGKQPTDEVENLRARVAELEAKLKQGDDQA
ncbi:DUF3302 domain-containing protein [Haloferula sp. BvORR071]|uniref:DUF3302 domain-containing protein n=1 Tax=Haloferula sp. BvORR071 TaxID=1396141 RepID=UPI0009DDE11A|nr:DUF3302 domain-containing protein [Haloferula sp. BvORR071]